MAVTIPANDRKASNLYVLSYLTQLLILALYVPKSYQVLLSSSMLKFLPALLVGALLTMGLFIGLRTGHIAVKYLFLLFTLWTWYTFFRNISFATIKAGLLALSCLRLALCTWAAAIVARDLLRRPVAGEAL